MITSANNSLIKKLKKLRQKKYRVKERRFLVEGVHLVEEALLSSVDVVMLVTSDEAPLLSVDISENRVVEVNASVFAALSDTESPQGWLAVCKMPAEPEVSSGNVLLLDGIRDPGNLGTMIRTAAAAGLAGIYVSEDTVDMYNPKVIRATQGAMFHLPVIVADLKKAVSSLKEEGIIIYGTDMHSEFSYRDAKPQGAPYALLLGNEAQGISPELLSVTDKTVSIPILGKAESLNVAVAAGIIMYDWIR
ncbi:TrmH family RNA methyltransferase [Salicibibacter kimchii]|uniref:RNA methyltransferase n=1 Tax=Salicibibacter kimchii TaxID=2099786 RepID=A0A345BY18_9BACI|nr:RNA methyltransferase [Salicibibacter kimchii]AXF55849.1 RNA methyltransferase [Salicibibacter kimchii]